MVMEDCFKQPNEKGYYKQCLLFRLDGANGALWKTAWIQEKLAEQGLSVRFKEDGEWSYPWTVVEIGDRKTAEATNKDSQTYKKTRKHSDLPKGTFKKEN
jgi:hypothetical protein